MATTTRRSELEAQIERIDEMVQRLEEVADPLIRATATDLVQSLMALHGAALERIVDAMKNGGSPGKALMDQLGRDELVRSVLVLYSLHPVDVETRVKEALEKTRPYLKSHGGNVELVGIDDGEAVRLRMQGSCHGCPSSALTLKMAIEDAIREAAPEVTTISVDDGEPAVMFDHVPNLVPMSPKKKVTPADIASSWEEVSEMERLAGPGVHIMSLAGHDVLFCSVSESLYAYADCCAACGHDLRTGMLDGRILKCAYCGDTYDIVKAGRGIDQPAFQLEPFPLLMENGRARVALPMAALEAVSNH
ncbi:MAG: NifU family protein [Gemmatimonadales bacterium]